MATKIDDEIRARVETFTEELSVLIRQAAVDAVEEAIGGMATPPPRRKTSGGRRAKAPSTLPKGRPGRSKAKRTASGRRRRRRSEEMEALKGAFSAYVAANPGQRLEEIGVGMGEDTADLKRPVQLLLEEGKLRTEGQKRGTRYFTAKGGGRRRTKKKAAGRKKRARRK